MNDFEIIHVKPEIRSNVILRPLTRAPPSLLPCAILAAAVGSEQLRQAREAEVA